MKQLRIVLSILFITLFCAISNSQNNNSQKEHYLFFDKITGVQNSDLHYGIVYREEHRIKNKKTKFFHRPDFVLGSVFFDGLQYFDIPLKYNVYDDELLMLIEKQFGGNTLQLYKAKVDAFTIGDYHFRKIEDPSLQNGFYQVLLEMKRFSLLKKHQKILRQLLGKKRVYYEFEEVAGKNFLLYSNKYHLIKNTGDIISLFPEHREALESFDENEESSLALKNLLEHIDTLMLSEYTKKKGN